MTASFLVVGAVVAGCSVVTPPPIVPAHDIAAAKPEGTTSVTMIVGFGGGVFIDGGYGFELRVTHQVSDKVEIGGGIGLAFAGRSRASRRRAAKKSYAECLKRHVEVSHPLFPCTENDPGGTPDLLVAARFIGKVTPDPDTDWIAVPFSVGVGIADTGLTYFTVHSGGLFSSNNGGLDGYAEPTIALSVPLARGPEIEGKRPPTTFWFGASLGGMGNADGKAGGSGDGTMLFASDGSILLLLTAAGSYRHD